jgi:hypothetical protein
MNSASLSDFKSLFWGEDIKESKLSIARVYCSLFLVLRR